MSKIPSIAEDLESIGAAGVILAHRKNLQEEFKAIRGSYRSKILTVHPDKGGSNSAFHEVQEAYDRLKRLYDDRKVSSFASHLPSRHDVKTNSLPRSPNVFFSEQKGEDMMFCAYKPQGAQMGQPFLAVVADVEYTVKVPQNYTADHPYIWIIIDREEVAENLSNAKSDDVMNGILREHFRRTSYDAFSTPLYAPDVFYVGCSGEYMSFCAAIPQGVRNGEGFWAKIAGGKYKLHAPHKIIPGKKIHFHLHWMVVAKYLTNAKDDDPMHRVVLTYRENAAAKKSASEKRKKERNAARISTLMSNDNWRSALAAGKLDNELNDVLKGVLDRLYLSRTGRKAVLLERLREYVAKDNKENERKYPKDGWKNEKSTSTSNTMASKRKARAAFGDVHNFV